MAKEIKLNTKKSYLTMIKNASKTKIFANYFAKINSKEKDILENGRLSCAFFVSSILKIFNLIENIHLTVKGTIKDLEKSGWQKTKKPKIGDILVWEEKQGHYHIGFYLGREQAVSNSSKKGFPEKHHFTYSNQRKIIEIFSYDFKKRTKK